MIRAMIYSLFLIISGFFTSSPSNAYYLTAHDFQFKDINGKEFSLGDFKNKVILIKEKPKKYISDLAITGLYFFDNSVVKFAKELKPSKRGELEIVDLINKYKQRNKLSADLIGRGGAWLDTGSIEDFYKTSAFVQAVENRQGLKIACLEEIAYLKKWIKKDKILNQIRFYGKCEYSNYLKKIITNYSIRVHKRYINDFRINKTSNSQFHNL